MIKEPKGLKLITKKANISINRIKELYNIIQ